MLSLAEIKIKVEELAKVIDAPPESLPDYGRTRDFAYPHIEVHRDGYHYVAVERGVEIFRKRVREIDDLLELVFRDVASSMAGKYELRHRIPGQDTRRLWFAKHLELLAVLDAAWAAREADRIEEVLRRHPYQDDR